MLVVDGSIDFSWQCHTAASTENTDSLHPYHQFGSGYRRHGKVGVTTAALLQATIRNEKRVENPCARDIDRAFLAGARSHIAAGKYRLVGEK
ncbi:hypothetical protein E2C01_044647 [Portunus trituberculatus]|uniref:Uncharacterized protein n=1 Tax=Portunus trituberculatus TaxID=210409 RepID=A0A5B7G0K6_PORTR|nr:hypothetical protein [Portunus trituberculatus]